jgi:hypothetical protein
VTFANFNFCVVNMRQYLPQVAYVAQRTAHRAIPEMIGVGFSNTVRIAAGKTLLLAALSSEENDY